MTQGVLPFQYEVEKKPGGLTALAGLPTYLEFGYVMGLNRAIEDRLKIRSGEQGWSDAETVMALILLNLADGQGLKRISWGQVLNDQFFPLGKLSFQQRAFKT